MARKSLGHIKLQWTCPNCGTINPGPQKLCSGCGAPQPDNVKFEQAKSSAFITDEKELSRAKAGADIHCPYCGTRNPGDAKECIQCGGDLSEGQKRESGNVVGAYKRTSGKPIKCPNCGSNNLPDATICNNCGASLAEPPAPQQKAGTTKAAAHSAKPVKKLNPVILIIVLLVFVGLCATVIFLLTRTSNTTAEVTGVYWERSINIEEFGNVTKNDWKEDIPYDAEILSCHYEYAYTSTDPEPYSTEVCGTPYTEDEGSGYGEVVVDCEYQVYEEKCDYSIEEWHTVDTVMVSGNGFDAQWPSPTIYSNQRLGTQKVEKYEISFSGDGSTYNYETTDYNLYQQCQIGSQWILKLNTFNALTGIEPAN